VPLNAVRSDGAFSGLFFLTALLGLSFCLGLVLALNLRAWPTKQGWWWRWVVRVRGVGGDVGGGLRVGVSV
jgi:hypothetical protein